MTMTRFYGELVEAVVMSIASNSPNQVLKKYARCARGCYAAEFFSHSVAARAARAKGPGQGKPAKLHFG